LGIDPVKPENAELCGDDPVCDVKPLAGPKDSLERVLPIKRERPALVIGLYSFADHGENFPERFLRAVLREASAVKQKPRGQQSRSPGVTHESSVSCRQQTRHYISLLFHENADTHFLVANLEPDSWLSKIGMTSIGSDIISLLLNRHNIFLRICQMQIKNAYVY